MAELVGDEAWARMGPGRQMELADVRGEYQFYSASIDKLAPLGLGGGRLDPMRWNLPSIGRQLLSDKLLSVMENRCAPTFGVRIHPKP
jgi:hypothetical protein